MRLTTATGFPLVVLFLLAAELFGWGPALEYRRSVLAVEPWRLVTGHFVHLSVLHAMLNGVALLLIGRLFADRLRASELWVVLLGAPLLISLAFWIAMPGLAWYRGLSGTLHALYFAGCVTWLATSGGRDRWLPAAALVIGTAKVLLEQPWDSSFPFREWLGAAVVPQAHLIGAFAGSAAGLAFKQLRRGMAQ